jgi:hypothetical protein
MQSTQFGIVKFKIHQAQSFWNYLLALTSNMLWLHNELNTHATTCDIKYTAAEAHDDYIQAYKLLFPAATVTTVRLVRSQMHIQIKRVQKQYQRWVWPFKSPYPPVVGNKQI